MTDSTKHLRDIVLNSTGIGLKKFVENVLNQNYGTFSYRHNKGHIHISDYLKISVITGKSLDELISQDPRYQEQLAQYSEDLKEVPKTTPILDTSKEVKFDTPKEEPPVIEQSSPPPEKKEDNGFQFIDA